MVEIAEKQYEIDHLNGGRKDGPTARERVEITLKYCKNLLAYLKLST